MKTVSLLFVVVPLLITSQNVHATFGVPTPVGIGTTYRAEMPSVSADELTVFFGSAISGTLEYDLYYATRPNKNSPFGTAIPLSELNTSEMEWGPSISSDGLSLYFARGTNWNGDIYVATRTTASDPFGEAQSVAGLNTSYAESGPCISSDGLSMYFAGNILGNVFDLFVVSRPDINSPFGTPVALSPLNTVHNEAAPAISPDGLTIYFRRMYEGGTQQDIWSATRPDTNSPFGDPYLVPELNYPGYSSYGPDVSFDGQTIYFGSDRVGSLPGNLWMARVIPEPTGIILMLVGLVAVLKRMAK